MYITLDRESVNIKSLECWVIYDQDRKKIISNPGKYMDLIKLSRELNRISIIKDRFIVDLRELAVKKESENEVITLDQLNLFKKVG